MGGFFYVNIAIQIDLFTWMTQNAKETTGDDKNLVNTQSKIERNTRLACSRCHLTLCLDIPRDAVPAPQMPTSQRVGSRFRACSHKKEALRVSSA